MSAFFLLLIPAVGIFFLNSKLKAAYITKIMQRLFTGLKGQWEQSSLYR